MWHNDRMLYALLIAAGISVLARFGSDATAVFVGAVASTYVITAGVGFSGFMRYEMVMFPAAAVAAGGLVQLALGDHLRHPVGASAGAANPRRPGRALGSPTVVVALALTKPGRFLGLHLPTPGPLEAAAAPQLAGPGGRHRRLARTAPGPPTVTAPASPSFAAAQGGSGYAVKPLAKPPADQTLRILFAQAIGIAHDNANLQGALDWTHAMRYQPDRPRPARLARPRQGRHRRGQPQLHGPGHDMAEAYGRGLSLNSTVKPDTVKILSRQVSAYGEDVVFTVQDTSGKVHQGTRDHAVPDLEQEGRTTVTSMVFDSVFDASDSLSRAARGRGSRRRG